MNDELPSSFQAQTPGIWEEPSLLFRVQADLTTAIHHPHPLGSGSKKAGAPVSKPPRTPQGRTRRREKRPARRQAKRDPCPELTLPVTMAAKSKKAEEHEELDLTPLQSSPLPKHTPLTPPSPLFGQPPLMDPHLGSALLSNCRRSISNSLERASCSSQPQCIPGGSMWGRTRTKSVCVFCGLFTLPFFTFLPNVAIELTENQCQSVSRSVFPLGCWV